MWAACDVTHGHASACDSTDRDATRILYYYHPPPARSTSEGSSEIRLLIRERKAGSKVIPDGESLQCSFKELQARSYGRGAPRPVVPGVLRTPDGVVNVRLEGMSRPRKAAGLLNLPVRSPSSSAARSPDGAGKVDFLERSIRA